MEQITEINEQEVLASAHQIWPVYKRFSGALDEISKQHDALRKNVIELINAREHLRAEISKAELKLGKVNEEARARLGNIEKSHQALVERLTRKEIDLIAKQKEAEAIKAHAEKEIREHSLVKAEYERRLEGFKEMASASKSKGK